MNRLGRFIAVSTVGVTLLVLPSAAHAACTSPSGAAGSLNWNSGTTQFQYCDGTTWQNFGGGSTFAPGTVGAPGWAVTGDTDTGLWAPAANTISVSAGGVQVERWNTVTSAVNYFSLSPATSGNDITLAAAGTDTNIGITLTPKGAGTVTVTNGSLDLAATTSSSTGVITKGGVRFIHNFAAASTTGLNTFVGVNAGNFTMAYSSSGSDASVNTGVGYAALAALTSGTGNTGIGYSALGSNTTGASNTATGRNALSGNTTGSNNTANGYAALAGNTTGTYNVGTGNYTIYSNATGTYNTANGYQTLYYNTVGSANLTEGFRAGFGATTASDVSNNVMLGYQAGYGIRTGGDSNVLVGFDAGFNVSTGARNTIIGYGSGTGGITTGSYNILLGDDLRLLTATASNQLDIGNLIFGTGVTSGATLSGGSIGIGSSSPQNTLDVSGTIRSSSSDSNWTTAGWAKAHIMPQGYALFWEKGASGVARGIGASSNGVLYITRSTANDTSATPTYDMSIDTSGNIIYPASGYTNFGSTGGASGYGIRDNAGTIECKNSGGSWAACAGATFAVGTVSAPGWAVSGDTNTGLWSPATDTLSISSGGVEVARYNTTASAVNYLTFTPGAAGSPGIVTIGAAGTSTNVNVAIAPKGSGALTVTNGNLDLAATTTSSTGVITKAGVRFIHNFAAASTTGLNTFVGVNAGNFTMAYSSAATDASYNIGIGYATLIGLTTGSRNTGNGYAALASTTTGIANTANGYEALYYNTTGNYNTANGFEGLIFNTTGDYNLAEGYAAGIGASGASDVSNNVMLGSYAGYGIRTGGDSNVMVGYQAGKNVSTGAKNIIIGYASGTGGITTGSDNILIGDDIRLLTATSSNQLDIGNLIFATGLTTATTLSTGSVGIGTASPGALLDAYVASGSGGIRVTNPNAGQDAAFLLNPTGASAHQWKISASDPTRGTYGSDFVIIDTTAGSARIAIDTSGNVGIGTVSPNNRFSVGAYSGQSTALIAARGGGNSFEFGHNNTAGYGSTIGADNGGGNPFVCLSCEAGTTTNTYMTRGKAGTIIRGDLGGGLTIGSITTTSADNQAMTSRITLSSAGDVGIGTASPGKKLDVNGTMQANTYYDRSNPSYYLQPSGVSVLTTINASALNAVGGSTAVYGSSSSVGVTGVNSSSSYFCNLGTTSYSIQCSGPTSGISDRRLKKDITPLKDSEGLAAIMQIEPVHYRWKDERMNKAHPDGEIGFIAQNVETVLPQLVSESPQPKGAVIKLEGGTQKALQYERIAAPLVKAVQELKADNDNLRREVEELRREIHAR